MAGSKAIGWRYRGEVLMRTLAALAGGYAGASAVAMALARRLPMTAQEAAISATLPSFLIYAGAVLWAFAARSAAQAWIGPLTLTTIALAIAFPPW
jgi:hypothetical protein